MEVKKNIRLFRLFRHIPFVPLFILFWISSFCIVTAAQTPGTGIISGRVTVGDRPLAGVTISLQQAQPTGPFGRQALFRAVTDADGRYQMTGVPAGSYSVTPLAPPYILPSNPSFGGPFGKPVNLNDGDTITGVDLALVRGGVITGKVTDPDGRPVIEQYIQFEMVNINNEIIPLLPAFDRGGMTTDDRGIYRIYGITPGRYRVSAGEGEGMVFAGTGRKPYPRTYHPDAADAARAKIVEVAEGGEATGVDIRLRTATRTFAITGRAVDESTGEGASGVPINYNIIRSDGRPGATGRAAPAGPNGEFRIEGLRNGRFQIVAGGNDFIIATPVSGVAPGPSASGYSDPVTVDVLDGDVSGIELRVRQGASVSGIAVVEGTEDPAVLERLSQAMVFAFTRPPEGAPPTPITTSARIGPDRTFRFNGVRPGRLQINASMPRSEGGSLTLARVERDGVPQPEGIEVGPGEQIAGVRLVFVYGNGVVRGQVNVINGALPEGAMLTVYARRLGGGRSMGGAPSRVDARGQFVIEGLAPGEYELETSINIQGPPQQPEALRRLPKARQRISIANGQVLQVFLVMDAAEPRQ
ncbi:MAG: carboxypeptidase regulatory-like domain-containing protein [Acidobacteria bacterium]|nr:carboxypeptidase regulatory-like domain-containing protein [Acidobacteriota bacterium]MCW5968054.1 carboxypeptidase regulatory-like domain-containing protein [Blastocatellales bacterium]